MIELTPLPDDDDPRSTEELLAELARLRSRVAEIDHEELLDARDVCEAADELIAVYRSKRVLSKAIEKLEVANKKYWRKWAEQVNP